MYWCCSLDFFSDNGKLLLRQLLGQIIRHPLGDLANSTLLYDGSPDANPCCERLTALLGLTLSRLLERAPVVIVIDSIQSYESGAVIDRNVRAVLNNLVEMAKEESKHPLKLLITSTWHFQPLREGAKITTTYKLPLKVKQDAWKDRKRSR